MRIFLGLFALFVLSIWAQDWQTTEALPAIDLSSLSPAQKASALKLLRQTDCSCGCGMKLAECRVKDPNCSYSRGMATVIVESLKAGKSEADALAAAKASRYGHRPGADPRVLGDPVNIPIKGSPILGRPDARITLVEFSDFQCPFCIAAIPQLQALMKAYPNDVRLVFKQFPLDNHSQAALAAAAALAAHKQGKFWQLHDAMFEQHGHLSRAKILELAAGAGVDRKRFEADLDSPGIREAVSRDVDDGYRAGVEGTPTLFVDGRHFNRPVQFDILKDVVEGELKGAVKE